MKLRKMIPVVIACLYLGCSSGGDDGTPGPAGDQTEVPADTLTGDIEAEISCVPDCQMRVCGDDGCGGLCGECDAAETCEEGLCVPCDPDCGGLFCGDDGCGGTCGICDPGIDCVEGVCLCPIDCEGKDCGADGCGGSCGECPDPQLCAAGQCVAPEVCDHEGFEPISEAVKKSVTGSETSYLVYQGIAEDKGSILLESFQGAPLDGPATPGTYSLNDVNYADCGLCILGFKDCTDEGCAKLFYADQGWVVITSIGGPGGMLQAQFQGVTLTEVTIDTQTFVSTPVPDGDFWCMDGYDINAEVMAQSEQCVPMGTGFGIGNNIADFTLQNCAGEQVSLHQHCGEVKAVWLIAVSALSTESADYMSEVTATYNSHAGGGLEYMVLLGEDQNGAPPDQFACNAFAEAAGVPPDKVFIDLVNPYGAWGTLFTHVHSYVTGNFNLPWEAILDGDNMAYLYATGFGPLGSVGEAIDAAMKD